MTKFFLHGGMASKLVPRNDDFYNEIIDSAPETIKILLVYFAVLDRKKWAELAEQHKAKFKAHARGKRI